MQGSCHQSRIPLEAAPWEAGKAACNANKEIISFFTRPTPTAGAGRPRNDAVAASTKNSLWHRSREQETLMPAATGQSGGVGSPSSSTHFGGIADAELRLLPLQLRMLKARCGGLAFDSDRGW